MVGAIQLKALLPTVVKRTDDTTRVTEAEDLRDRVHTHEEVHSDMKVLNYEEPYK